MDILIFYHGKNASSILERVKSSFSQEFPDRETEWKPAGPGIQTAMSVSEEEITKVFRELVEEYPEISVMATCSREIREDDRSAQWWVTTKIYSETEDGETRIVSSSDTYWN